MVGLPVIMVFCLELLNHGLLVLAVHASFDASLALGPDVVVSLGPDKKFSFFLSLILRGGVCLFIALFC